MKKNSIGNLLIVIIPLVLSVVLLYPTYQAVQLEKVEAEYIQRAVKNPADSMKIMDDFHRLYGEKLDDAKKNRLKLGLDLRGGMYVTLEADVLKLVEESANEESKDEIFAQVIEATRKETALSDANTIDVFLKNFDNIARPKKKYLYDYFDFNTSDDFAKAEQQIQDKLRENETEAVDQAIQVIRQRVDKFGISEPTIQKQGSRRVVLELPGVTDEQKMLDLVKTTARLEFKSVHNDKQLAKAFYNIDKFLASGGQTIVDNAEETKIDTTSIKQDNDELAAAGNAKSDSSKAKGKKAKEAKTEVAKSDTAKKETKKEAAADTTDPYANMSKEEAAKKYAQDHPFTILFVAQYAQDNKSQSVMIDFSRDMFPEGVYNFMASEENMKKILVFLQRAEIKNLLPEGTNIYFNAKPMIFKDDKGKDVKFYNFFACKDFQPKLTGEVITDAVATYDQTNNQPIVNMSMNSDGAERWAKITGANIGKRIAVILDDQVYTAPNVLTKITGGSSQITGMENAEEARLLKIVLKSGALKAPVQAAEVRVVGPSLGEDSINSGVMSSIYSFSVIVLFMLIYYGMGGLVANISLAINFLLVLGFMAAFDGTLTLPGIAGLILSIGMAVDANILIYERIREELGKGRNLVAAVDEGFSKALTAIIDSNLTTFITGLILYYLGSGPIQGFAMTLMMGIIATLFTATVVSKAIIKLMLKPNATYFNFGQKKPESINSTNK